MIGGSRLFAGAFAAALACSVTGCASHAAPELLDRLRVSGEPALNIPGPSPTPNRKHLDPEVRKQLETPRPPPASSAETLERQDRGLSDATAALEAAPTAEHHRQVAYAYRRLGVLDAAFEHFSDALRLYPKDALALDGRARIWRDWGLPQIGLGDAYRAASYAPSSAVPLNTLGTLFYHLGRMIEARDAFERALVREPGAAYAQRNLCEVLRLESENLATIPACQIVSPPPSAGRAGAQ